MTLRAALAVGDITPEQHYWQDGMEGWAPLMGSSFVPAPEPAPPVVQAPAEVVAVAMAEAATPATRGGVPEMPAKLKEHIASQKAAKTSAEEVRVLQEEVPETSVGSATTSIALSLAVALGVGLAGGVVWIAFVMITGIFFGLVAWGIGGACGGAVRYVKGPYVGIEYGVIAAGGALLGILLGYYVIFVETLRAIVAEGYVGETPEETIPADPEAAEALSYVSLDTMNQVLSNLGSFIHILDFVFLGLAMFSAFSLAISDMAGEEEA